MGSVENLSAGSGDNMYSDHKQVKQFSHRNAQANFDDLAQIQGPDDQGGARISSRTKVTPKSKKVMEPKTRKNWSKANKPDSRNPGILEKLMQASKSSQRNQTLNQT